MFVFSVARPFVCGCHIISTLPSARTIPGLPGSLASLLHRVARTHLGAMGWNQCAFAPIVRARPFPIFGRPVHPRDGSRRLRPGGSPHALQTPPRGGRPALQSFRSWLQLCLGRVRLSPSCPFRHLHYLSTLRPVRHYPHLLDIDPWPRAERDFNPPETRAARHALFPDPIPDTASAGISLSLISAPTAQGSRSMFVFSVARPFVCGCHIISTLPSARTIPGLPGSLASLLHRVARTHLGAMGWNQCAFAPIVRARPFPIFGRPVHPRDGSRRLRPGGSPHALQTPPRGGRPALQSFRSWLQLCLGRVRLSPSCPFRHLHYLSTLRPVRHYPHLLDIDPWPRAERDFNPPETRAARHALFPDPIPDTASAGISLSLISAPTAQGSRSMFVFSVARPFVCGCHIISTLPSARTIPGLPGSLASLLHRVARTHLGAMGWNQCAFAPIVRARPFPIFGRPVHPRDGSRRLRPGGSPHALQTPPRGGRPALQSFRSWLQLCLGRIRLSPSCPFRHLHYLSTLRPVRHYPHLLDIDPWPRAERDFNPPETRAARHAPSARQPDGGREPGHSPLLPEHQT